MPRVMLRFLSLLLGLVPSLLGGSIRADDARASDPPPKGEVTKYTFDQSKIFPGTVRDYWVYVPKQYDPAKPACVYVNQDGVQYKAPAGLRRADPQEGDAGHDRRVRHARPGEGALRPGARPLQSQLRIRRPGRRLRPVPARRAAARGRDRRRPPTAGRSGSRTTATTAASAAPAAARSAPSPRRGSGPTRSAASSARSAPTSACAAATSIRRSIRKYEPKPIRVFLQDGSADLNIYGGDWWMANQEMERALTFAGYEVNHVWGDGGHNGKHATEIFPDAMRWLWKDWPAPVKAGAGSPAAPGDPHPRRGLEARRRGLQVHRRPGRQREGRGVLQRHPQQQDVQDRPRRQGQPLPRRHEDGPTARRSGPTAGSTPSPPARARSSRTTPAASRRSIADGFRGNDLVVRHDGGIYVTNPGGDGTSRARSGTSAPRARSGSSTPG